MSTYHQLTQERSYRIYALKKTGHSRTEIAAVIGVHKSTVSRELQRNRGDEAIVRTKPIAWQSNTGRKAFPGLQPERGL